MKAAELEKYLTLVRQFPLRAIRSERELDRAIAVVDELIDRPRLSSGEREYLDALSELVEAYENEHYPMPEVSDARLLAHLIESRGVTQSAVAKATRIANSTLSAVLQNKRQLTRDHIGRLAAYFHVEPGAFAFPTASAPSA